MQEIHNFDKNSSQETQQMLFQDFGNEKCLALDMRSS
jgi:hypothetical protein